MPRPQRPGAAAQARAGGGRRKLRPAASLSLSLLFVSILFSLSQSHSLSPTLSLPPSLPPSHSPSLPTFSYTRSFSHTHIHPSPLLLIDTAAAPARRDAQEGEPKQSRPWRPARRPLGTCRRPAAHLGRAPRRPLGTAPTGRGCRPELGTSRVGSRPPLNY